MQANDSEQARAEKARRLAEQEAELAALGYQKLRAPNLWRRARPRGEGRVPPIVALPVNPIKLAVIARRRLAEIGQ